MKSRNMNRICNRKVSVVVDIQTVSIAIASAGVLVAAIYYMLTLRYNVMARRMELCRLVTSDLGSEQGCQRYATMMNMEWKDYEDFREKYGYSNPRDVGQVGFRMVRLGEYGSSHKKQSCYS